MDMKSIGVRYELAQKLLLWTNTWPKATQVRFQVGVGGRLGKEVGHFEVWSIICRWPYAQVGSAFQISALKRWRVLGPWGKRRQNGKTDKRREVLPAPGAVGCTPPPRLSSQAQAGQGPHPPSRDCTFLELHRQGDFQRKRIRCWVGDGLCSIWNISLAPRKDLLDSSWGFDKFSVFFKYLNIYSADILISMTVRTSLEFLTGDTQKSKGRFICR